MPVVLVACFWPGHLHTSFFCLQPEAYAVYTLLENIFTFQTFSLNSNDILLKVVSETSRPPNIEY